MKATFRFRAFAFLWLLAGCGAAAQAPERQLTLILTDHHFRLTAPVEGGRLLWRVRNEGSEPHQALIVKLPDGVNEYQERAWLDHGSRGPRPGQPMGGVESLAPGKDASFTTDLPAGKYLLLCTIKENDARHYELGMIYRFTIE